MWKYGVALAGLAFFTAQVTDKLIDDRQPSSGQRQIQETGSKPKKIAAKTENPLGGRKARIRMDSRGHFVTQARMNGRRIEVLVDTGATSVAINTTTARRLGIKLSPSDFKYTVNTANGRIKAASATIDRIEIGRVSVTNVRAAVLKDASLTDTLLGMSFLKELDRFEIRNRELVLEQ